MSIRYRYEIAGRAQFAIVMDLEHAEFWHPAEVVRTISKIELVSSSAVSGASIQEI